ncbi:MAG: prephenate dehydrogenase/arogenate dehydrogenase family protein, partial [Planctomycetales bacterium]|nr:prephenate dehydrogenase/arogenate dehydrogenase family protein [Planctomycetales bacterium]
RETFCGSHPLAGSEKSGVGFALADLFAGKLAVITPSEQTPEPLAERTEKFWQALGSRTLRMTPQEHDCGVARTSHLPHIVASALAAATPQALLPLAASGWCDTTRVAAGGVELWQQILLENRQPVLEALQEFSASLQPWIAALSAGDTGRIEQLLQAGKQQRDSVGN